MIFGLLAPLIIYVYILVLHLFVPARKVIGYVEHDVTGEKLTYRLNGLFVMVLTVATGFALVRGGVVDGTFLWDHRWQSLIGACVLGLLFTLWIVLTAPPTGKSLAADLFLGRYKNPQFFRNRVDAKMYLYLIGAIQLELNVLSFAAHARRVNGGFVPSSVVLYVLLFSFFLCEYLFFEEVHRVQAGLGMLHVLPVLLLRWPLVDGALSGSASARSPTRTRCSCVLCRLGFVSRSEPAEVLL
jgi:hypothetical protein